jgi:hypothetical protein
MSGPSCIRDNGDLRSVMSTNSDGDLIDSHLDAVGERNRFSGVRYSGLEWDLTHLNAFALKVPIGTDLMVDVVVLFSCHCFTHAEERDPRARIPSDEFYRDAWERRVLDPERYRLSRLFLPRMIRELSTRKIRVVAARKNFFTMEATDSEGKAVHYAVFFTVEKDKHRKKRLLLRVQSAYPVEQLDRRHTGAGKVNFAVLLRATYEGRTIRG